MAPVASRTPPTSTTASSAADLDHSLERLLPVSTLGGVEPAVDLLLDTHRSTRIAGAARCW